MDHFLRFYMFVELKNSKTHQRTRYHRIDLWIQTKILNVTGQKLGKCEFFVEMWVGLQISEEKICIFGKKLVGPENAEEKMCDYVPQIFPWPPCSSKNFFVLPNNLPIDDTFIFLVILEAIRR